MPRKKSPPSDAIGELNFRAVSNREFDRAVEHALRDVLYERTSPIPSSDASRVRAAAPAIRKIEKKRKSSVVVDNAARRKSKAESDVPAVGATGAWALDDEARMKILEGAFEHGNYGAALDAIALCYKYNGPVPRWLLQAAFRLLAAWAPGNDSGRIQRKKGPGRTGNVVRRLADARRHYLRWDFIGWVGERQFIEKTDRPLPKKSDAEDIMRRNLLGVGKINAFSCASNLLEGTEIEGSAATMRYSYDRMERAFSDRKLAAELLFLSSDTAKALGLPELDWDIVDRNLKSWLAWE